MWTPLHVKDAGERPASHHDHEVTRCGAANEVECLAWEPLLPAWCPERPTAGFEPRGRSYAKTVSKGC